MHSVETGYRVKLKQDFLNSLHITTEWRNCSSTFTNQWDCHVKQRREFWLDQPLRINPSCLRLRVRANCSNFNILIIVGRPPPMRFLWTTYDRLFRLSSIVSGLRLSANSPGDGRPTFSTAVHFARKLTMHSTQNAAHRSNGNSDGAEKTGPEPPAGNTPTLLVGNTGSPAGARRFGNVLDVNDRNIRTPSPLFGANCDDDSEAESFRDGRSDEVDRETKSRAFIWCRDFLSGSWRTIHETDFHISIVRYFNARDSNVCHFWIKDIKNVFSDRQYYFSLTVLLFVSSWAHEL